MYIRLPDQYPYHPEQLRRDVPGTSFPSQFSDRLLADYGVYPVVATPPPNHDPTIQAVVETLPRMDNTQWTQTWAVRDLTPAELFDRIPKSVSALQGMRAIQAAGLVQAFLAWKSSLDPVADFEAMAFLDKAQNWVYDDPIIDDALTRLGVAEQKAALFTLAATL